jgi:hypothetical protein
MASNYPGPFELRIIYQLASLTPVIDHTQRLNVDIDGDPEQALEFDEYVFVDKNGVYTITLDTLVEDWLTLQNALFHNSMAIIGVELWKYPVYQSYDSVFWAAYEPTAAAGTSVSGAQPSGQNILTFRTQEGGTFKLSLMESSQVAGAPLAYAGISAGYQALVDFALNGDGSTYSAPFLARDTSYPIAFHRMFPGQSEALFKKRNRV